MAKWGLFIDNRINKIARTDAIKDDIIANFWADTFVTKQLTDDQFSKLQKEIIGVSLNNDGDMVWSGQFSIYPIIETETQLNEEIARYREACELSLAAHPNGDLASDVKEFLHQLTLIRIETDDTDFTTLGYSDDATAEANARADYNFTRLPIPGKNFAEWMFSQTNVPTLGILEIY